VNSRQDSQSDLPWGSPLTPQAGLGTQHQCRPSRRHCTARTRSLLESKRASAPASASHAADVKTAVSCASAGDSGARLFAERATSSEKKALQKWAAKWISCMPLAKRPSDRNFLFLVNTYHMSLHLRIANALVAPPCARHRERASVVFNCLYDMAVQRRNLASDITRASRTRSPTALQSRPTPPCANTFAPAQEV